MTTNERQPAGVRVAGPVPTSAAETAEGLTGRIPLSPAGKEWLKAVEQLRLAPYDDQTGREIHEWVAGATIGYGHLILRAEWDLYRGGIDASSAGRLLDDDLHPFVELVNDVISVAMRQSEFDAAVMLAYNIGGANFSTSSVAKLINDPCCSTPYARLEDAWKAWNKSQGAVCAGLVNRRNAEWGTYTDGIYATW